jgi:hypothetical protein
MSKTGSQGKAALCRHYALRRHARRAAAQRVVAPPNDIAQTQKDARTASRPCERQCCHLKRLLLAVPFLNSNVVATVLIPDLDQGLTAAPFISG